MPELIRRIVVSITEQSLSGFGSGDERVFHCAISTAANGAGQQYGSECTPLGNHRIRAKIGQGQPTGAVFVARRPTGEVYSDELAAKFPRRDWILTRILWLCGNEPGKNRGGSVDTQRRFIYIHGAPDSHAMGIPDSHGCIKMRNNDIIALFDRIELGSSVLINE